MTDKNTSTAQERNPELQELAEREYEWGFVTDIEQESIPPGLDESVIRTISAKKGEPAWLLEWRLKAYQTWLKMTEPDWALVSYPKIDYQDIVYYAAPKSDADRPKSLDEVDPELLATYEKLGIPLKEQAALAGVAVDAVFDSVSVATTFKDKLSELGIVFCSFSEAVQDHPELVKRYLGTVVPRNDNFFAALNSAVFSDGSFVYIPEGVRCPMELSTYFRINAKDTGQFERTLIVAEKGSLRQLPRGLHRADARREPAARRGGRARGARRREIKYSTVQNWYPGATRNGKGGIYNFVTKRGACRGVNSKISWTQVETGSAITWKYPSCILQGDNSIGEFYSVALTNNHQQADTGTKMIHIGKNTRSTIISKGISAGHGQNTYRGAGQDAPRRGERTQLLAVRLPAHGRQVRRAHLPLHRRQEPVGPARARGQHEQDRRGPDLLSQPARTRHRGRHQPDRQRLLQGGLPRAADGVRGRGPEAAEREPGRRGRLSRRHKRTE